MIYPAKNIACTWPLIRKRLAAWRSSSAGCGAVLRVPAGKYLMARLAHVAIIELQQLYQRVNEAADTRLCGCYRVCLPEFAERQHFIVIWGRCGTLMRLRRIVD